MNHPALQLDADDGWDLGPSTAEPEQLARESHVFEEVNEAAKDADSWREWREKHPRVPISADVICALVHEGRFDEAAAEADEIVQLMIRKRAEEAA